MCHVDNKATLWQLINNMSGKTCGIKSVCPHACHRASIIEIWHDDLHHGVKHNSKYIPHIHPQHTSGITSQCCACTSSKHFPDFHSLASKWHGKGLPMHRKRSRQRSRLTAVYHQPGSDQCSQQTTASFNVAPSTLCTVEAYPSLTSNTLRMDPSAKRAALRCSGCTEPS